MRPLAHLVAAVDALLGPSAAGERTVVVRPGGRPVARVGLALDPDDLAGDWVRRERLDAVLLHRHWRLDADALPAGVGVLANHAPFDERLGLGESPWLAAALGGDPVATLGARDGAPLGMVVALAAPAPAAALVGRVDREFDGIEAVVEGTAQEITRVVTARAMTDALVREAAAAGAGLYLTGQLRRPAEAALRETGLYAIAVGHRRSERWALALLAGLLRERLPGLEVVAAA